MKMNLTFSGKRRDFARRLLMSLLFGLLMLPVRAQERVTVSGRLTDTGQNPLIGASVIEAGTTNGVTTDRIGFPSAGTPPSNSRISVTRRSGSR